MSRAAGVFRVLNLAVIAGLAAQYYTVGLVIFSVAGFPPHLMIGRALITVGLLQLITALVGRVERRATVAVFVLLFLQPMFVYAFRNSLPALAAVHAVNGLVALGLALRIEAALRRTTTARTQPLAA